MKNRILMVDDHKLFLAGLCDIVAKEQDMEVVGMGENGNDGIALARKLSPDIIIWDIAMPGMNGIEAAAQVKKWLPNSKMAALSMHLDKHIIGEVFKIGMRGYILKEASPQEFIYALRIIAGGEIFLSPKVATMFMNDYLKLLEKNSSRGEKSILSERETQILQFLVHGKSSTTISAELHISKSTVDTHRRNILDKFGCENVTCLTRYALREGLVDLDD